MAKLERWVYTLNCHCGKERVLGVDAVHGFTAEQLLQKTADEDGWKVGTINNDLCPQHNNTPVFKTDPTGLIVIP